MLLMNAALGQSDSWLTLCNRPAVYISPSAELCLVQGDTKKWELLKNPTKIEEILTCKTFLW
jgi:hypothetical protein